MHKIVAWRFQDFFGLLPLVLMTAIGCGGGSSVARVNNTFRANLGAHPANNIVSVADEALQVRYGYRFTRRVESGEDIYFETEWKDETALDDERALGIDFVRLKIWLTARPRNRLPGASASFTTTFRAEVESRINMTGEWTELDLSPQREEYFDEIARYIENELRIAFRN